jgi:hypothetical protein
MSRLKRVLFAAYVVGTSVCLYATTCSAGDSWREVSADSDWKWCDNYIFLYAKYVVACEAGRVCEVGSGVSFKGKPRGSTKKFEGSTEATVIGIGALYVRAYDGKGPVKVQFLLTDSKVIDLPKVTW